MFYVNMLDVLIVYQKMWLVYSSVLVLGKISKERVILLWKTVCKVTTRTILVQICKVKSETELIIKVALEKVW